MPRIRHHCSGAAGLAVLAAALAVALSGAGVANASWTTPEKPVAGTVAAGTLTIEQTGLGALTTIYTSGALSATAPVTLHNAGTVPAPYTLSFRAQAATALAGAADVRVWPVASAAGCTAATTAAGPAGKTWLTAGAVTGTLAPNAVAVYCVRSSVSQSQRFALVGGDVTATASAAANQGSWTSAATATTAQSVADTLTPGVPARTGNTDQSITFKWSAPADALAVTGYRIYRDSVLVGSVAAPALSFTDTGLVMGKGYVYTVRAAHAATPVDLSPASLSASLTTGGLSTSSWYVIRNVATQLCLDAEGVGTASGTALISYSCNGGNNQSWRFTATGTYYRVAGRHAPTLFWDSPRSDRSILRPSSNVNAQQWTVTSIAPGSGTVTLRDRNNRCLDIGGGITADGNNQLKVAICDGSADQAFTLTNGG